MRATSVTGVWVEDISPDIAMTCDTRLNVIHVTNKAKNGSNVSYQYEEEIKLTDVIKIKDSIERTCRLGVYSELIG